VEVRSTPRLSRPDIKLSVGGCVLSCGYACGRWRRRGPPQGLRGDRHGPSSAPAWRQRMSQAPRGRSGGGLGAGAAGQLRAPKASRRTGTEVQRQFESHQQIGFRLYCMRLSAVMAIDPVSNSYAAWGPPPVLQAVAGGRINDASLGQFPHHQIQSEMQPVMCTCGTWPLDRAAINDGKAPGNGSCGHGWTLDHMCESYFHPMPTGGQALSDSLSGRPFAQSGDGAGHLTQRLIETAIEKHNTQPLVRGLNLRVPVNDFSA
jgi:hypothetical protein